MFRRVALVGVAAGIALLAPAVAHADAHDDDFVNSLADQGITGDPSKLVMTAHMVCTASTESSTVVPAGLSRLMPMGYVMSSLRLAPSQANQFADMAQTAYCAPPAPGAPATPGAPVAAAAPAAPGASPVAAAAAAAPAVPSMPIPAGIPGMDHFPGLDRLSDALAAPAPAPSP